MGGRTEPPFVVYWNNIPSPYMVDRFNAVADRDGLRFEAWFNDRIEPDRSWSVDESTWRFRYRYLPRSRILGRVQHWPVPIMSSRPDVLVSLYAEPVFLFGWLIARMRGVRTVFWCQVTSDRWVRRAAWKEMLKRTIFPRVGATIGSGEESREFAMRYGVPPARAWRLQHSIDVRHFVKGEAAARATREQTRKALGLQGTTFLYVGRLWEGKGLIGLVRAYEEVTARSDQPVSLLIVGDGSQERELRRMCAERGLRNVVFAGFKQKSELPGYYCLADVFVFPTLGDPYGLVVDEAMACSLPVIGTSAAGEITERIEEGVSGYVVAPDDPGALAERMLTLARDRALRVRMGSIAAARIRENTPEKWASDFEGIVRRRLRIE